MKTALDRFMAKGREASIRVRQERARQRTADLKLIIEEIWAGGAMTLQATANALNARGIPAARGGSWSAVQVNRVLAYAAIRDDGGLVPEKGSSRQTASDSNRASGRTGVTPI